jgi:hypothetical protein
MLQTLTKVKEDGLKLFLKTSFLTGFAFALFKYFFHYTKRISAAFSLT